MRISSAGQTLRPGRCYLEKTPSSDTIVAAADLLEAITSLAMARDVLALLDRFEQGQRLKRVGEESCRPMAQSPTSACATAVRAR